MQESILDDPYIAELRERRRQIDEVKVQREKDGTKVKKMNIE